MSGELAEERGGKSAWGKWLFAVKLLLACGIIGCLAASNFKGLPKALEGANFLWLAPAALLYLLHMLANAWRWWLLMRAQRVDCKLSAAVSLTMQSLFFSLVIPGGAAGGDIVRASFLAARIEKGRKFEGAFTILMDRFTGMAGIFIVAVFMLPWTWDVIAACKGTIEPFVKIIAIGSVAGLLAAIGVFAHREFERIKLFLKCKALADRFSGGLFSRVADAIDTYKGCPKELSICVVASVVLVNLNLGFVAYLILKGLGSDASFGVALAAMTVGNLVGLLPLTPSGFGARDIFVVELLKAGGTPSGTAMAATLLMTVLILLGNMLGGVFFVLDGMAKKSPGQARCPDAAP